MKRAAILAVLAVSVAAGCESTQVEVECGRVPPDECTAVAQRIITEVAERSPGAEIVKIDMEQDGAVLIEYLDGSWSWSAR